MKIEKDDITKLPAANLLKAYRSVGTPTTCDTYYTVWELQREILRRLNLEEAYRIALQQIASTDICECNYTDGNRGKHVSAAKPG